MLKMPCLQVDETVNETLEIFAEYSRPSLEFKKIMCYIQVNPAVIAISLFYLSQKYFEF